MRLPGAVTRRVDFVRSLFTSAGVVFVVLFVAVGAVVFVGSLDGLLKEMRTNDGDPSFGLSDLVPSPTAPLGEDVESWEGIVRQWQTYGKDLCTDESGAAREACGDVFTEEQITESYLLVDSTILVPAYVFFAFLVWKAANKAEARAKRPPEFFFRDHALWGSTRRALLWIVGIAALADILENVLLLVVLDHLRAPTDATALDLNLARAAKVASGVKWIALLLAAVPLVVGTILFLIDRQKLRSYRRAWPFLVMPVVFIVLLRQEQAEDAIRRWDGTQFWAALLSTLLLMVVCFTGAARAVGRPRRTDPLRVRTGWRQLAPLGLAVLLVPLGLLGDTRGILVLAGLAVIVLAGSLLLEGSGEDVVDPEVEVDERGKRFVAAGAVAITAVGFALAVIRSLAPELFYRRHDSFWDAFTSLGWQMLAVAVVSGLVLALLPGLARAALDETSWFGRSIVSPNTVVPLVLAALGAGLWWRLSRVGDGADFAASIGTVAVVAVFVVAVLAFATFLTWLSERAVVGDVVPSWRHPQVFRLFNFKRPPLIGLVLAWALLASFVDQPEYYDIRWKGRVDDVGAGLSLQTVYDRWLERQPESPVQPMLVVSSSGGGIRAAYWTAALLSCIVERETDGDDPCADAASPGEVDQRRNRIFVMSGISGGSLGIVTFDARLEDGENRVQLQRQLEGRGDWYRPLLDDDFLAPTLGRWLFGDVANLFVRGKSGQDRAEALETAWERAWDTDNPLAEGFLERQHHGNGPLLLLNSFSAEDGCRLEVSALQTNGGRSADRCGQLEDDAQGGRGLLLNTTDLLDLAGCAGTGERPRDIARSTAALLSARFPFVSPSGRLESACEAEGQENDSVTYAVDGGYLDTSGSSPVVELWPTVERELARTNGGGECVAPFFLQIDNGYEGAGLPSSDPEPNQLLVPSGGRARAPGGVAQAARQAAARLFSTPDLDGRGTTLVDGDVVVDDRFERITTRGHPGTKAPLGWVLSESSITDLERQVRLQGAEIEEVRAWLDAQGADGEPLACTSPAAG